LHFAIFENSKKAGSCILAPIVVKILICRCSAYKIVTDSGTTVDELANVSAPKISNRTQVKNKNYVDKKDKSKSIVSAVCIL
jgi:hypothetical protein